MLLSEILVILYSELSLLLSVSLYVIKSPGRVNLIFGKIVSFFSRGSESLTMTPSLFS